MAQRGTTLTADQVAGIALTQASSSPLGGISVQSGTSVTGTSAQSGQLLVFTSGSSSIFTLPSTTSALWTASVLAAGAGSIILTPPTGTTLNGSTSPITVSSGSGAILFSDGAGSFRALLTGSGTSGSGGSAATPILSSDGTPMADAATGEWLYPAA